MPSDPARSGPANRSVVNIHAPQDVRWWCRKLGCTELELRNAVSAVGMMTHHVEAHLQKKRQALSVW